MKRRTKIILGIAAALVLPLAVLAVTMALTFADFADLPERAEFGELRFVRSGIAMSTIIPIGPSSVALIDAGQDPEATAIKAELARMKLGPDAVKTILFTHGHTDHTQGAMAFPKAALFAMPQDIPLAEGRAKSQGPIIWLLPGNEPGLKVGHTLVDGETLVLGEHRVPIRVFAMPGHTAGGAAFLVGELLILGDDAHHTNDGELRGASWIFSDSLQQNHASLKRLLSRLEATGDKINAIFTAHSGLLHSTLAPLATLVKGATS